MNAIGRFLRILACLALLAFALAAKNTKAVLLLAREQPDGELITKEVNPMVETLVKAGFRVVIASEHGTPIIAREASLRPDLKFSAVVLADYAGLVIPCMEAAAAPYNYPIPAGMVKIAKAAAARKLPIAAQDLGVITLGTAGVLKGRQYAADGEAGGCGGTYKGTGVWTDGTLVTSGSCPVVSAKPGTEELMKRFIQLLQ
jgi:hypothetical protein